MLTGKVTVTVACAVLVLSALLVAVTAQLPAVVGAVNVTGYWLCGQPLLKILARHWSSSLPLPEPPRW